ncbi:MAG TPA: Nramp family divalent metal transporter [Shinella sp.]|jgi:NRAMP (natural resistance-associated macrophage protein)-like metal ion transporter|uniref:Nramp family divalent metal transporter n=1 Tax=Shinella sp. TaxID=1870904 RepID=UPI002E1222A3|nr:Nramp family divalent metal transporter [Shinella sp.]
MTDTALKSPASLKGNGNPSPVGGTDRPILKQFGPGLITGAADDDPSGITTYSQAGAQFGFNLLWLMLLTYPLMSAIQMISGRIGRVTGCGLAANLRAVWPNPLVLFLVGLLFIANTINIGANLSAMGASAELATGLPSVPVTILFAALSLLLQMFVPYHRYASYLKWLTMVLLSYVAVLFVVKIDWTAALKGFVMPSMTANVDTFTVIVAILGTTISPYLFFWQTSQEVEEMEEKEGAQPLRRAPRQAKRELRRIRIDTFAGMAVSNLVAIAIIMSTAATLHTSGKTEIATAADVAEALKPIAGNFAFALFSVGIIGTAMLSIPVLAGSAAYAAAECCGWAGSLERKPAEAIGFYSVIAAATVLGLAVEFMPIDPIRALFWSAVINGFVAVPIMVGMMTVVSRHAQMKQFTARPLLVVVGWTATAAMAAAAIAMLIYR